MMRGNMDPGRVRRLAALVRKETYQLVRDPSSILIAFVLPMIMLFLFGYGVSLDTDRTRIGLVVEEPTSLTHDLSASFRASRYFDVTFGSDRRIFEDWLIDGSIRGIVVVPAKFTSNFAAGIDAQLQVIVDGSDPNTAKFVQNYTQGVVASWRSIRSADKASSKQGQAVEQRFWFNPELTSRFFLVPGSIAIIMTLVGTLLTSLVIAREWERGTMEAMMATPVTSIELLVGKILPYFVLGLTSMTLCVLLAVFLFGVPFRGSVFALYVLSATFLVPALGQGLLISAATKNQFLASQAALISAFLPSFLLSGFLFEINSMPTVIQWITFIVPARYLIPSLQTLFLAGDIWSMFLQSVAVMLLIGSVFFVLAARSTRKRIG